MASASSQADIGAFLERSGWKRSVAGDEDFSTAVESVRKMAACPKLGICLMGNVGVGKTALAEAIFRSIPTDKARIDCSDNGDVDNLVPPWDADANGGSYNSAFDDYMAKTVMIDDLGREAIRMVYGNTLDRIGNFIVRYHLRGTGRLLITTNLSASEIERVYTSRVLDRIFDMCVVAKLNGKSKRQRIILGAKRQA